MFVLFTFLVFIYFIFFNWCLNTVFSIFPPPPPTLNPKNMERFTNLRVIPAQGPRWSSLYCSDFSTCAAEASTLRGSPPHVHLPDPLWPRSPSWKKLPPMTIHRVNFPFFCISKNCDDFSWDETLSCFGVNYVCLSRRTWNFPKANLGPRSSLLFPHAPSTEPKSGMASRKCGAQVSSSRLAVFLESWVEKCRAAASASMSRVFHGCLTGKGRFGAGPQMGANSIAF